MIEMSQVCNHPDLFERRDVVSPLCCVAVPTPSIPRLIYHHTHHGHTHAHRYIHSHVQGGYTGEECTYIATHLYCYSLPPSLPPSLPSRLLNMVLGVHSTHHIHRASLTDSLSANEGVWSFLRLIGLCPREMSTIMLGPFIDRYNMYYLQ